MACIPEESHADQLTRDEITASVHYIRFELTPAVNHPEYQHSTALADASQAELLSDLRG